MVQPTPMPAAAPVDSEEDPWDVDDAPVAGVGAGDAEEVLDFVDIADVLLLVEELETGVVDLEVDLLELDDVVELTTGVGELLVDEAGDEVVLALTGTDAGSFVPHCSLFVHVACACASLGLLLIHCENVA